MKGWESGALAFSAGIVCCDDDVLVLCCPQHQNMFLFLTMMVTIACFAELVGHKYVHG